MPRPSKAVGQDDPLLPSCSPSPEIYGTHTHSPEIRHIGNDRSGTKDPDYSSRIGLDSVGYQHERTNRYQGYGGTIDTYDNDDHNHNAADIGTVQTTMSKCFRTVFGILFLCIFVATFVSAFRTDPSEMRPRPIPFPGKPTRPPSTSPSEPRRRTRDRALAILDSTPLIDGHNDLAIWIREHYQNNITSINFRQEFEKGPMPLNVDLPRMRQGRIGGAFWSTFVVCPNNASYDMSTENYASAVSHTAQQIDLMHRLQDQYSKDFTAPGNPSVSGREEMLRRWRADKTFFGPISIEGLHQISPSAPMSSLRQYYRLGVRMATLTWNCHNPFADAAIVMNSFTTPAQVVNGIFRSHEGPVTKHGRRLLKEMNRLGMIIDISHTSYWTQKAVLTKGNHLTRSPVVFSHSSAYRICPHPRNVKDDILDLVRDTKSLVMVNFSPDFISCTLSTTLQNEDERGEPIFSFPDFYEKNNTLHQVARHIKYIGDRIGFEYVGLGSDFDGMGPSHPEGLSGVDKFPALVEELLNLGITDAQAAMIVGGNILRVWEAADATRAEMLAEGVEPELDDASGF